MPKYIEYETLKKKINDAQAEKAKFPFNGSLYETGYHNGLTMALTFAMYSTAADVAPVKHGRWIEYTKVIIQGPYNKREQAWKCSECGFDDGFIADPFCLNCGARMGNGIKTDAI